MEPSRALFVISIGLGLDLPTHLFVTSIRHLHRLKQVRPLCVNKCGEVERKEYTHCAR